MSPDPARPAVSHRKLQLIAAVLALLAVWVVVAGITTRQSEAAQLRERADAQAVVTVAVITPSRTGTWPHWSCRGASRPLHARRFTPGSVAT